jgi:hypothetical protein
MKKIHLPVSGYVLSEADALELENRFTYHAPLPDQTIRYEALRAKALEFAKAIATNCPKGREEAVAFTNLEQSLFWANAAIARNEYSEQPEDSSTDRVEKFRNKGQ